MMNYFQYVSCGNSVNEINIEFEINFLKLIQNLNDD